MKRLCLMIFLLSPTIASSMCQTYKITDLITAQNRKSFDEIIDDYDPCMPFAKKGLEVLIKAYKRLIMDIETLNRAFDDSPIKEKQD